LEGSTFDDRSSWFAHWSSFATGFTDAAAAPACTFVRLAFAVEGPLFGNQFRDL